MAITPIAPISSPLLAPQAGRTIAPGTTLPGNVFGDLLNRLTATEQGTTNLLTRAATGENVDISDVMIATQTEALAFQVGLQVRNKLVEAYQEVFRMQV